jgi:ribonuclease HI
MWLLLLSEGTAIIYTDGSRTNDGGIGAGWSIGLISNGKIQFMIDGFCYLSMKMEIYDAKLHAVSGLKAILSCNFKPGVLRICIDNSASVLALSESTLNDKSCSKAKITSDTLIAHGWDIGLVWTPSHLEIDGNEREDQVAKKGSAASTPNATTIIPLKHGYTGERGNI